MIKAKTHKPINSYSGDKSLRIDIHDNGNIVPMFNVYPKSNRLGRYYSNDRYSNTFKTITEAKEYAIKRYMEEGK